MHSGEGNSSRDSPKTSCLGLSEARKVRVSRALDAGRLRLESSFGSGLRSGLLGEVAEQ
jgi:hypothetical protein